MATRSLRSTRTGAPKRGEATAVAAEAEAVESIDVQYNPEIINSALRDLELQINSKCTQIQKDADFMCTSIKQAFHLELIKLPKQVKTMSMSRFRSEFGESLEAVTRGALAGGKSGSSSSARGENSNTRNKASTSSSARESGSISSRKSSSSTVFQTPSGAKGRPAATPGTSIRRAPREGEQLLSKNGSPLGEFDSTAVKAAGPRARVPATPGNVQVPLNNGDIVDIDEADIDNMTSEVKQDALAKMQAMMANMQNLMDKLAK